MVLPTVPIPELNALLSLRLAYERVAELVPLASATESGGYDRFVRRLRRAPRVTTSISTEIRSCMNSLNGDTTSQI
jgi:hypothetical protein